MIPEPAPYWQGDLIRLRAVEPGDWEYFQKFNDDVLYERWTYFVDFPTSQEALKNWTTHQAVEGPDHDAFRWIIETNHGEFLGTINSHTIDQRAGTFQYGIAIHRDYWRNGYASEAVFLVLRYYFHEKRYQKANVHIYSINPGSVAFHEAMGFRLEGRLRRMGFTEGTYYDHILMGLTVEEFNENYLARFKPPVENES